MFYKWRKQKDEEGKQLPQIHKSSHRVTWKQRVLKRVKKIRTAHTIRLISQNNKISEVRSDLGTFSVLLYSQSSGNTDFKPRLSQSRSSKSHKDGWGLQTLCDLLQHYMSSKWHFSLILSQKHSCFFAHEVLFPYPFLSACISWGTCIHYPQSYSHMTHHTCQIF